MANYKGHVAGSIFFGVVYLVIISLVFAVDLLPRGEHFFSGYAFPVTLLGITVLFGLFPDIDTNSHAQKLYYSVFVVTDVWLIATARYQESALLGLIGALPVLSKHRGWTHFRWSILLVPLPLLVLPALNNQSTPLLGLPYYGAAVFGYVSHLYFDGILFKKLFG